MSFFWLALSIWASAVLVALTLAGVVIVLTSREAFPPVSHRKPLNLKRVSAIEEHTTDQSEHAEAA